MILTWENIRTAAVHGEWKRIKSSLNTVNPIRRETLFGIALEQRCWEYVILLFRQGFGTRRLEEVVDIALRDNAWYFLADVVHFRPSLFKTSLLTTILSTALDQQLWGIVFDMGSGISSDIDAMLFDRAVSMKLDAFKNSDRIYVNGLVVNVSLSAKRWSFVFGTYFGQRGVNQLKATERYRSQRRLDPTRRRRAFDELLKEYFSTKDGYIESLLLLHFHQCPCDLQDKFFLYTVRNKLFETAYDIIEKELETTFNATNGKKHLQQKDGGKDENGEAERIQLQEKKEALFNAAREDDVLTVVHLMRTLDW